MNHYKITIEKVTPGDRIVEQSITINYTTADDIQEKIEFIDERKLSEDARDTTALTLLGQALVKNKNNPELIQLLKAWATFMNTLRAERKR